MTKQTNPNIDDSRGAPMGMTPWEQRQLTLSQGDVDPFKGLDNDTQEQGHGSLKRRAIVGVAAGTAAVATLVGVGAALNRAGDQGISEHAHTTHVGNQAFDRIANETDGKFFTP